jgi:hypothetical protein
MNAPEKEVELVWNRAARRFFARLLVGWGGMFAVVMVLALQGKGYQAALITGTLAGAAFGLLMALIYAPIGIRRSLSIIGEVTDQSLANRQTRLIDVPMDEARAFAMLTQIFADVPGIYQSQRDDTKRMVKGRVYRVDAYGISFFKTLGDEITMRVLPSQAGFGGARIEVHCGPRLTAALDWWMPDFGGNLQHAELVSRAIARRVAEDQQADLAARERDQMARQIADAKLVALESQVAPHFLYNTLANAQLLTRSDPAGADVMLGHLITFLRSSLKKDGAATTIAQEVARTRAYLEIMRVRMGERLQFQIDVDQGLDTFGFPSMVLQMLTENAIKHGIEPNPKGGTIHIAVAKADDAVTLTVSDNGRGFGSDTAGSGIGLSNIRERLRLSFGDGARLTLQPNQPHGVVACVSVPLAQHQPDAAGA